MKKLPEGWYYYTVDDVSGLVTSGSRDWAQYYASHGALFIRMGNLTRGDIQLKLDDVQYVHIPKNNDEGKRTRLKVGDVLISITAELGKLGYVEHDIGEAYINQHVALVRIENKKINPKFFAYWLALPSSNQLLLLLNDAGTKAGLNLPTIKNLEFPAPAIEQQNKIVEVLSFWDQQIESIESILQTKREHKRALMQRMLTGKLRFPEFAGQPLHIKQLGDFIEEVTDRNKSQSITRVLSVTNHSGFVLPEEQFSRRVASEDVSNYKIVRKGQFAYNPSRINVGSLARLQQYDEGILSPMYVIFKHDAAALDSEFLWQWLRSDEAKKRIAASTQGSVRDSVGYSTLAGFNLKVPSLSEQRKIAAVLSTTDREIEQLTQKLNAYKQQKKGLMQQLLTGKKRVNIPSSQKEKHYA